SLSHAFRKHERLGNNAQQFPILACFSHVSGDLLTRKAVLSSHARFEHRGKKSGVETAMKTAMMAVTARPMASLTDECPLRKIFVTLATRSSSRNSFWSVRVFGLNPAPVFSRLCSRPSVRR